MQEQAPSRPYLEYIRQQIEWYDGKACWNQSRYKRLQVSAIVLSALTPLILAANLLFVKIQPRWDQYVLTLLPIVVSVAATVSATMLSTFKYHDNWLQYRETCERLRRELLLYESQAKDYANARDPEGLLVRHTEEIMARENANWLTFLRGAEE